jgi:hypothetical protein
MCLSVCLLLFSVSPQTFGAIPRELIIKWTNQGRHDI